MQIIKTLYRNDYLGEEVATRIVYQGGERKVTTEYMPNQLVNLQTSNQALVIGNGTSRLDFDLARLKTHRAGILGAGRLQSYGCNALYRDYETDFLVVTGEEIVKEIAATDHCADHIVYANLEFLVQYPKRFYMVPQDPHWNAGSIATYLACFDGHTKVFLLGFDGNDMTRGHYNVYANTPGYYTPESLIPEVFWEQSMLQVFQAYPMVDFVRVAPTRKFRMPESWQYQTNLRTIDIRDFVVEADF